MSKMKRLLMLVICAIFVVSLVSIPKVNAAEPNPWQYTNDEWHFYVNGEPVQGWVTYNGYTYYLNWDGSPYRGTNSFYDETTQKWSYYRFNEKPNDQRPWGGEMITGWYKDGENWEYYKADGKRASNEWIEINSKWYYIDYRYMAVGKKTIYDKNNNPSTYYFSSSGVMQTNFWYKNQYNEWEYYKANGKAARDEWVQLNSKWYYFSSTSMVTGVRYINNYYYYFNTSGVMMTNT